MKLTTDPKSWKENDLVFLTHEKNLIVGVVVVIKKSVSNVSGDRSIYYSSIFPDTERKTYFDTSSVAYRADEIYNSKDAPYRAIKDLFKTKI